MSKYVIEIEEKPLCVFDKDTQTFFPRLWRVKGFNSLVLDEEGLSRLEELNSDYINEHFGELQDTAYKKGFEDGKAVNDKRCEGCLYNDGTKEHSPCDICCNAYLNRWTAKPQEDDKIEVGDEVIYNGTTKCIVVRPEDDERYASLIDSDGTHYSADHRECKKTGRHFDIQSILEDMRHD